MFIENHIVSENKNTPSNYMQFLMGIEVSDDREVREDYSVMRFVILKALTDILETSTACDCGCGRSFEEHVADLDTNPNFRNHLLTMIYMLKKCPELALAWMNSACIETATTDWPTIEDNAAHLNLK